MSPAIKNLDDAIRLCQRLANYYQRRVNRLLGVGVSKNSQRQLGRTPTCMT
jgi:hypothetical protein